MGSEIAFGDDDAPARLRDAHRNSEGVPRFQEAREPTVDEMQDLLAKIITRILRMLTRQGHLIEESGMTYLAHTEGDRALTPLQAASCTDRMAPGPRAGQKVLSLHTVPTTDKSSTPGLCINRHGFSLHAGVRCGAHQRQELERLCRTITRPAIANERLKRNGAGGAATEECLPGRHHAYRHVRAGMHATARREDRAPPPRLARWSRVHATI